MTEKKGTPTPPTKPDGVITTQRNGQTIVAELFFNHNATETFSDKLLKTILADSPLAGGRHDRYGAEQQQGSQQVCGFQQFHGRGRPPQEASANRAKVQLFAECRLSF